ncbi:MAG TPA: DUF3667 domain-containing protein [Allosphingosinicella sp.]|jgi:hypothetical protein
MTGLEAIGEAVTGGLAARAVEPEAGEGTGEGHGPCLNCGTELVGPHCHQCGQHAHVHRTLGAWWHDLAHGVLHLDGKIWRTLPLLAWRPGELTRRYVEGERAKFVSPIAIFLFSVFLMFAVFSTLGGPIAGDGTPTSNDPAAERAEAEREFKEERAESLAEIEELRRERAAAAAEGRSTASLDVSLRNAERQLALEERLFRQAISLMNDEAKREADEKKAEEAAKQPGAAKKAVADADEEKLVMISGADSLNDWLNSAYKKAKENPSLLAYKVQTNAYKFSWLLIPISVPFVWLLFLHRRRYRQYKAYDHTVFVTYSIAFMSLGVIALSLLRPLGFPQILSGFAMMLVPPIHMYRQLRGAYLLSRFSAFWRMAALIFATVITTSIFFLLLLALGVLG